MALANYDNLKAAVKRIDRSDISDLIDDAIDLVETEIYHNATECLRLRAMETRSTDTLSTSTRFLALPSGYLELRNVSLVLSDGDQDIKYSSPEGLVVTTTAGKPVYFTVTSQFEFDRVADSAYTVAIDHYAKPTALSSSNTTNTVLTNFPNIYLFGCLWAVKMFNGEEELSGFYYNQFINAIRGANKGDKRGRYGPAPRMKFEGMTP